MVPQISDVEAKSLIDQMGEAYDAFVVGHPNLVDAFDMSVIVVSMAVLMLLASFE
jgi:hypothetical protein